MFQRELKFISDLNLNKLQDLGSKFTLQEIKNSKIHPSLFKYIEASVELEILQDRIRMQSNSKFDYSGDRINNYFCLITKEIKRVKTFEYSYASTLLQKAIVFNANYLTRPNHTLIQFIYSDASVRTIDELQTYLAHSYYYRYLQKILLTYFDKKKILKLSKEEFASLLMRVDSISRNTHLYDTLDTAINSMTNFFDPSLNFSERVPLEAVRLYLKEKGLHEFLAKFNKRFSEEDNSLQLASEIQSVLKTVIPEEEIELEDVTKTDEDEFITTEEIKQETGQTDIENNQFAEKVFEEPEQIVVDHTETIVNAEDDYHVIENQDILSESHLTEQTEKITETAEENDLAENEVTESTTLLSEEHELLENGENETPEVVEDKIENIKETREKPNTKGLLRKLIDLYPIYDSLIAKPKPFESSGLLTEIDAELLDSENDETKYQMDISTLQEELTIEKGSAIIENSHEEEFDGQVSSNEYDEYMGKESLLQENDNSTNNNNDYEIGEKIDEIVTDKKYEEEFINQVTDTERINTDIEEVLELPDVLNDEKLKLLEDEDKEITEVFTDLSFLDKNEDIIIESDDSDEVVKLTEEETILENDSYQENDGYIESGNVSVVYSSFKEMLKDQDMTSIIEAVFDYDMEDYHGVIDNINKSSNQDEALKITEKYLVENHIDLSLKDVKELKKIIINYFSQVTT